MFDITEIIFDMRVLVAVQYAPASVGVGGGGGGGGGVSARKITFQGRV